MKLKKHLWEIKHNYYCAERNYFNNDTTKHYKSWKNFLEEWGDADLDYNLLFRYDWSEEDEDGNNTYKGDDYYRNGVLSLFYMIQRRGLYLSSTVEVCRADEPQIIAFLAPRFEYLIELWSPLEELRGEKKL